MKITKILFILSLFIVTSCSDDPTVEGTWKAESLSVDGSITFFGLPNSFDIQSSSMDYTLNLADPNFTTSGSYDLELTVTALGDTQTTTQSQENISGSGTYTLGESTITTSNSLFNLEIDGEPLTETQESATAEITTLTDNQMILTQNVSETVIEPFVGEVTTTFEIISTWTRQ